jgi:hypothetical protein
MTLDWLLAQSLMLRAEEHELARLPLAVRVSARGRHAKSAAGKSVIVVRKIVDLDMGVLGMKHTELSAVQRMRSTRI